MSRVQIPPFRLGEPEESLPAAWVFFHIGVTVSTCGRTGAGDRMSMVSGCGLMAERLEKRTRFDSLKSQPNFLVVCAKRRRQQAVNLLHWKHRGFDSLHYHYHARNSRKIGYPRVNSEGSTPSSSVSRLGAVPWCLHGFWGCGAIGSAPALQADGCGFESRLLHYLSVNIP